MLVVIFAQVVPTLHSARSEKFVEAMRAMQDKNGFQISEESNAYCPGREFSSRCRCWLGSWTCCMHEKYDTLPWQCKVAITNYLRVNPEYLQKCSNERQAREVGRGHPLYDSW